jgi:cobalt-zinc-cadmium efflux system outer membrane protein
MKMKVVGFVGLAWIAGLLGVEMGAHGEELLPGLSLKEALGRALAHNWDLLAARSDVDQATAQRILATEIQNPTASATLSSIPADGTSAATVLGNGFWQRSYESNLAVSQLLELHGKRALKRASADAGLAAARARLDDARRVLDDAVIKAYAAAALAEENGRLLGETAKSLGESARLAAVRFQAGDISASDQKQIEVAADRFALDALASATAARNARIAVDVLLGERQARGEWRVADRLEDLAATAAALNTPPAPADSRPERPDLAAARAALAKAEADLKLEKQRRLPDPTLDLQYDHQPPDRHNTVGLGVSIDLPLWHRHEGEIAAAAVARDQAERERQRVAATIASDRATARGTFEGALARWQRYRQGILPKAEEVREAVVYAYQHGGASLLALLEAERNANEIRLAAAQAAADTLSSAADLATSFNLQIFQGAP